MNNKHLMLGAFVITLGTIVYVDIRNCHDMPWPPRIIAVGIVFGMLDLFSLISEELANVLAIGIVLGAIVSKGFKASSCTHSCATAQPSSYKNLQNSPNPTNTVTM